MRGTSSRLKAVTPRLASARTMSPWVAGCRKLITTAPFLMRSTSAIEGACTLMTASASPNSVDALFAILAPVFSYASSGMYAAKPAPDSTLTSRAAAPSLVTVSGTSATRRSSGAVSLGVPTFTACGLYPIGGLNTGFGSHVRVKSDSAAHDQVTNQIINDLTIQAATVNGSGSQTANLI